MKRVLLIYGDPRQGKSGLAGDLAKEFRNEDAILSVDDLYVEFIKKKCQEFYFKQLRNYIRQHYHYILDAGGYTKHKFGRDFVNEWHKYLFANISERSARYDDLVVEGYLLVDCHRGLEAHMSQTAQVFLVHVSNRTYRVRGKPLTVNEIAALGQADESTA